LSKFTQPGVGPWDGSIRVGRSALPQPLPLTLGSDLSGEVAALGSGISNMAVGDQVFGVTNTQCLGAYAEYAVRRLRCQARSAMSKRLPFPSSRSRPGKVCSTKPASKPSRRERRSLRGSARSSRARLRSIATAGTKDIDYDPKRTSVHSFCCDPVPSCRAYIRG